MRAGSIHVQGAFQRKFSSLTLLDCLITKRTVHKNQVREMGKPFTFAFRHDHETDTGELGQRLEE